MTLNDLTGNRRDAVNINGVGYTDFLTGVTVIDSATAEQNVNGDGKLQLAWKSLSGGTISVGSIISIEDIGDYICLNAYAPTVGSDGVYSWNPTFVSTDSLFDKVYFTRAVRFVGDDSDDVLYTFNYSGTLFTIVEALNACAAANGLGSVVLGSDITDIAIPTLSFDGDTIKSAASKIAGAISKNITIIDGTLYIGQHEAYSTDDYYNRFIVLGGTRNMGKKTTNDSEFYTAVVQRLKLPADYPGSIISTGDNPPMYKLLIFDDVFPKMELFISSVESYQCWMLDENGDKVVESRTVTVDPQTGAETVHETYKKYHQFYITLTLDDVTAEGFSGNANMYTLNAQHIIAGKPLGILFQSGILQGREFDLKYYDPNDEPIGGYDLGTPADSVDGTHITPPTGGYRIIMVADGDTLLPNATLAPAVGDKVTLTGVALDSVYKARAQQELLSRALPIIQLYSQKKIAQFEASEMWPDFLLDVMPDISLGGGYNIDSTTHAVTRAGDKVSGEINSGIRDQLEATFGAIQSSGDSEAGGTRLRAPLRSGSLGTTGDYICTSITTNLITGAKSATFGTFKPKGLIASMVDQLSKVTVSGAGGTVGVQDDYYRHTAAMGIDQFNALRQAGGALGMIGVNQRITDNAQAIDGLGDIIEEVKAQSDRKFDIWQGAGIPVPTNEEYDAQVAVTNSYPAADWTTNELKELHLQDIYYDITREVIQGGGSAYRWTKETADGVTTYFWENIDDAQTKAALDGLQDVAADGKLSGGAEKVRVLIDWLHAYEEYAANYAKREGIDEWEDYDDAFRTLTILLNNGADPWSTGEVEDEDEFIDIATPSLLYGNNLYTTSEIDNQDYYDAWTAYYTALAAFNAAVIAEANRLANEAKQGLDNMASDSVLTVAEKREVLREWQVVFNERQEITAQAQRTHNTEMQSYYDYILAFRRLATWLQQPRTASQLNNEAALLTFSGGQGYVITDTPVFLNPNVPETIPQVYEGYIWGNVDSTIDGELFHQLWATYYDSRTKLQTAINTRHQQTFIGTSVPDTPYYEGDLWIRQDPSNVEFSSLMLCRQTRTTGDGQVNDWMVFNVNVSDVKLLMANLIEMLWPSIKDSGKDSFAINFGGSNPGSGNIWYDTTNNAAYIFGSETTDPIMCDAFRGVMDIIGQTTITVYCGESLPVGASQYDVYAHQLKFQLNIDNTSQDFDGTVEILMYDDGWKLISRSINSVLENLGNMINMVVFGSDGKGTGTFKTAAGAIVVQNAINLFAQAKIHDPQPYKYPDAAHDSNDDVLLSEALFGLKVEYKEGRWQSTAKMQADQIEFKGKTIINDNLRIDENGNISLDGNINTVSKNVSGVKMYTSMVGGVFSIGYYDSNDVAHVRYQVSLVEKDGDMVPVLFMYGSDGSVTAQFDENLGTGNISDSWVTLRLARLTHTLSQTDVEQLPFYPFIQWVIGAPNFENIHGSEMQWAVEGSAQFNDFYQFKAGNNGQNTAQDGKIFKQTNLLSELLNNGTYVTEVIASSQGGSLRVINVNDGIITYERMINSWEQ